eukprot:1195013-Prorocentrum_minimum.AAC.6
MGGATFPNCVIPEASSRCVVQYSLRKPIGGGRELDKQSGGRIKLTSHKLTPRVLRWTDGFVAFVCKPSVRRAYDLSGHRSNTHGPLADLSVPHHEGGFLEQLQRSSEVEGKSRREGKLRREGNEKRPMGQE